MTELAESKTLAASRTASWLILFAVLFAGVSGPFNQFKVPPVMPVLMERFHLDLTHAGSLMSIFAVTGLILALPAGIILQRYGVKLTGLLAVGCLGLGASLGALAENSTVLLTSRAIEGVGMGLIAVVGPAAIALWFPADQRGLPMGIWATWVSLGSLLIYNLAPALNAASGWQTVWWAGACFALVALLFYGLVVNDPPIVTSDHPKISTSQTKSKPWVGALANRNIWLLAISFACFNFVVIGVLATYYPTFLKTMRGFSLSEASFITSLKMIVVILTAPLAGLISDWIGSRKRIILFSLVALAIFMFFPFSVMGWKIYAGMAILGMIAGSLPSATFSAIPEIIGDGQFVGMGIGVVMIGQNLGQLFGPVLFSQLVEISGWVTAGFAVIGVVLAGLAATLLLRIK